ncbi:MAG: PilZ domain-containing protein [Planctomycetota bacterium]
MPPNPDEILARLDHLEGQTQADDMQTRRSFRRHPIRAEARLHPVNRLVTEDAVEDIQLRDVGRGGIGFLCKHPLPLNSLYRVDLLNQGYTLSSLEVLVRHVHALSDGLYRIGATFVIQSSLLLELGVSRDSLEGDIVHEGSQDEIDGDDFLPPCEVA